MSEHEETMTYQEHKAAQIAWRAINRAMRKIDKARGKPDWRLRAVREHLAQHAEAIRLEADAAQVRGLV